MKTFDTPPLRETLKQQYFTCLFTATELTHPEGLFVKPSQRVKGLTFDVDSTTIETNRNAEAIMAESLNHSPLLAVPAQPNDVQPSFSTEYGHTVSEEGTSQRVAARNTCLAIHFVIRGAEKRRHLAYDKAKTLQRELGVIPRLTCVK
jgi:hypothetical protein